ncbi:MAG: DUF721 domain-containing protein [Melioribacteraceae bacterium]|nr:DUF721 domain-containing protein [Melioribacteraceae bacterium]
MRKEIKSIKDIIDREKEFEKLRIKAKEHDVVEKFYEIFPDLVKVAEAKKVEKGKLFLRVENSVWRSELNFKQSLIVKKINRYFNEEVIETIKFL